MKQSGVSFFVNKICGRFVALSSYCLMENGFIKVSPFMNWDVNDKYYSSPDVIDWKFHADPASQF